MQKFDFSYLELEAPEDVFRRYLEQGGDTVVSITTTKIGAAKFRLLLRQSIAADRSLFTIPEGVITTFKLLGDSSPDLSVHLQVDFSDDGGGDFSIDVPLNRQFSLAIPHRVNAYRLSVSLSGVGTLTLQHLQLEIQSDAFQVAIEETLKIPSVPLEVPPRQLVGSVQELEHTAKDGGSLQREQPDPLYLLKLRMKRVEREKLAAEKKVEEARNSLSFQLGSAIIQATNSWRGFIALPASILQVHREAQKRRKKKSLKSRQPLLPAKRESAAQSLAVSAMAAQAMSFSGGRLRVACVMDEFTFHSYNPECELLQLHPERGVEQLKEFKPQLLFIESAWKGLDGLWQTKISNNSPEINACLQWCKKNAVPTLFWNKEDPVHFGTFLALARQVDYVFTTDIDCIPKYKHHVGHDRVFLLPFAAQPFSHNPVELYGRKDAFNFAGSYYLRYPERQRDFASLIDAVKEFRPIDIYDRNFDNPHPHYTFPDQFKPMILGRLPFTEIDRAYKGYRYGINMNTIKQSQTMFARRVFELLASNTVVVSNFSRGVRLLFGDLVVSSDNASQLQQRIKEIVKDDISYRKFRLLGLRKVMSEHTYAHRLAYIRAKLSGKDFKVEQPPVVLLGVPRNAKEFAQLKAAFTSQQFINKRLFIVNDQHVSSEDVDLGIEVFASVDACVAAVLCLQADTLLGLLDPADYYGPHYLTDLALASTYSQAVAFGKRCRYATVSNSLQLLEPDTQYRTAVMLYARNTLVRLKDLPTDWLVTSLAAPHIAQLQLENMLAIDEFNYIENGARLADGTKAEADNLHLVDQGVDFSGLLAPVAEALPAATDAGTCESGGLPQLSATDLHGLLVSSGRVRLALKDGGLQVKSTLEAGKHAYIYARKALSRSELNMVLNSQFQLLCEGTLEVRTVFEFQDINGEKISHQMNVANDKNSLAIPAHCTQIRFGLRIVGLGNACIYKLVLGGHIERPAAIVGRSPYLILSKQYPAYDDLYRYGFLHSRVRAYKEAGLMVDVFRISGDSAGYREFENIDVASGDADLLDATLATGKIKHVLVHLLDENMWSVLQKHVDKIRVTVWVHGAEIQVWQRRQFEFEGMSEQEIVRQKKLSDKRKKFWQSIMVDLHKNLHFVFVSNYFLEEVTSDLEVCLPRAQVSVIHNYIDGDIFKYREKQPEDRKKLLSIRPYASRKYANDLTVGAILELSKRSFFCELKFALYGDGDLFDEITAPLRKFTNVMLERRFLSQEEIAMLHQEYGVFITPTRMDAQGVSRDEAMSSGLVPITTNVACIPEFVNDKCGMVVPPEDEKAISDAIEELFYDADRFLMISESASLRVKDQCGFKSTIKMEIDRIEMHDA